MRIPLLGKVLSLGVVLLSLMAAISMVGNIVAEREGRLREAQTSVADSLAGPQRLIGPILQRQCEETWDAQSGEGKDRKTITERREFILASAPKQLSIDAQASLEPRYRGIYKLNGYVLKAKLNAQWADLNALTPQAAHAPSQLHCDAPVLFTAVGDARGLRNAVLTMQGTPVDVLPGTPRKHMALGIQSVVPPALAQAGGPFKAQLDLELVGTSALTIAPIGDNTQVLLASDWPHPSFQGRFLPNERDIGPKGFKATWKLSALATSASRDVLTDADPVESFGVDFIDPVNPYVLSDRATKYGVLFIFLTFVGVALIEVIRHLRVHPIQYMLVGCALAVFFLLLVSLTEHIPFAWAYLAASGACTVLLTFYGCFVLRGARAGLAFGVSIGALYGALYLLLRMEQTALVLGSLLLFAVLALVMLATRHLDWYALLDSMRQPTPTPPTPPTIATQQS